MVTGVLTFRVPVWWVVIVIFGSAVLNGAWGEYRRSDPLPVNDVVPMANTWQLQVVPPGWGNFSSDGVIGRTLVEALHNALVDARSDPHAFQYGLPTWVAGRRCTSIVVTKGYVNRYCNAVLNPVKYDQDGNRVPR